MRGVVVVWRLCFWRWSVGSFLERVVLFRGGVTAGGRCGRRRRDPFPGVRNYELEIRMNVYLCVSVWMCGFV
jgi:hypothetical protein